MADIRVLPGNIANMIAAGEVVERPAAVVKELMENAVDAGADNIDVIIQDAGRTLIQVIDNGCGMSADQAVLCFERHATSKIQSIEDLHEILTFGFRGEALASIAAVSEVTLKTRREEDEVGVQVVFADSALQSTEELSCPRGANFAVRNLFYNIPARRKFLKSDNAEMKHITSEFIHVALTRPDISFSLTHNGREIFVLKKAKSLKFRIQDVLGSSATDKVVDIHTETSVVKITGFVGSPESAKKTLGNQYFFVNGRFFKSAYFGKAVLEAYSHLIPEGYTPSYFIFLEVDPHTMDVNVTPTKTMVKFEEERIIFQTIMASIKEAIGRNSFSASIDFDREGMQELPVFGKDFDSFYQPSEPLMSSDPNYNPFDNDGFPSEPTMFRQSAGGNYSPSNREYATSYQEEYAQANQEYAPSYQVDRKDDYGKLFEDMSLTSRAPLVLHGKYIVSPVRNGLRIINIRRAKERILYERFLKALSKNEHISQASLFPVQVQVGVENCFTIQEHQEVLNALGFDISLFGNDTVVVNGVPEGYSVEAGKVQAMVYDLLAVLSSDTNSLQVTMMSSLAEKFAKLGAASEDSELSQVQAQRLIEQLFSCENAEFTSTGRRTMALLPIEEIDKKF